MTLTKTCARIVSVFVAAIMLAWQVSLPLKASAKTNTTSSGGYSASLTSPTPPASSDVYVWEVSGSKPGQGQEISHVTLKGCWDEDDVKSLQANKGTTEIQSDGTLKVDGVQDSDLPLTITVTFEQSYASTGTATVFVKTGGGSTAGTSFTTAGPSCQVQEYGSVTVNKQVDTDGDDTYEGGNAAANALGFSWGLDSETPARDMGTTETAATVGSHTVTENSINGYVFTGWFYTGDAAYSCANPRGTTLPVDIDVVKNQTTEVTLCNQVEKGSITIVKDAQPDSSQTFSFNIDQAGTGLIEDFDLEDDGVGSGNTKTYSNLVIDEYVITEADTSGWKLSDITCSQGADVRVDEAQRTVTINLRAADSVTCTFTNQQNGQLKVYKHTVPAGDQTQFDISASTTDGEIYGNADRTIADGEYELYDVAHGTYNVTETVPAGWTQTSNTCVDVVVDANNLYPECHITNTKEAVLTIKKNARPNNAQDFSFTSAQLGSFVLDDDSDPTLNNTKDFSGLTAGDYTITESAAIGWDLENVACENEASRGAVSYVVDTTTGMLTVTLEAGDEVTCEFTNEKLNLISGYKFEDVNGNSQWDQSEPALEGWTITLTDNASVNETTQTDTNGYYEFANLQPGEYTVCEELQAGWAQSYPTPDDCYDIVLEGPGQEETDVNFGNFKLGQVHGAKFNDANGNGVWDSGETTLKDWTISLYDTTGTNVLSVLGAPIATTQTDATGRYSFENLLPGTYKVCETQRNAWTRTYPASSDCHDFTIDQSGQVITANFGNKFVPQVLGTSTVTSPTVRQLANTGSSIAQSIVVGLTILGLLGAAYFLTGRRKDYVR